MSNIKMKVNSNATKQMEAIIAKVDTFPNRIASIQQSSLARSRAEIARKLQRMSTGAKYLEYDIQKSGLLGYKLVIGPPQKNNRKEYYAAYNFIKGRSGGQIVRAKNAKMMKLREESVRKGYPQYLSEIKLASLPSHKAQIMLEMREVVLKNLRYSADRFGFGPRGGADGLEDLPMPRSRARG